MHWIQCTTGPSQHEVVRENCQKTLMDCFRSEENLSNDPEVNLRSTVENEEQQSCTNSSYGYAPSSLSGLIKTRLFRLVVLTSLMRCALAVRLRQMVLLILMLRTDRITLREPAAYYGIRLVSLPLGLLGLLWAVFHIAQLTTYFPVVAFPSALQNGPTASTLLYFLL